MRYKWLYKIVLLIAVAAVVTFEPAHAQAPEGQEYTVQPGDWISQVAEQFLGDSDLYPAIVEATNAKAAEDDSFTPITDPNVIEVGQKLWIPAQQENVVGIYKTMLPGGSSPGLDITLYLNVDDTARVVSDYLNDEAPIEEIGRWELVDDQVIVTVTGRADSDYDTPVVTTLNPNNGTLVETEAAVVPGAYVPRYLPFDALATGLIPVPYDAAAAQQSITDSGYGGIYKAFLPAATCCGRDITLTLNPDGPAVMSTDFLNEESPIVESGSWTEAGEGRIDITFEGAETPLMLELVDGTLRTTSADDSFGSDGLTLYHFPTIALNSNLPTVSGTVTYRERIALPPQAIITVRLVDVSLADAPAEIIAEQVITAGGQQPPFSFELPYNPRTFDPTRTYAVQARIEADGELLFINDTRYPVLTNGAPNTVEMVLVGTEPLAAGTEEVNGCADVSVTTSPDAPPDRSDFLAYGEDSPVNSDVVGSVLSVDNVAAEAESQWRDAVLTQLDYCSGSFSPDQVTLYNSGEGQTTIIAASEVLFDDSVAAQEVRLDLVEQADGWQVEWGGIRFLCARGDNTTELQPALCP